VAMQKGMHSLAVMSLALAGASAGFLKYNFNPAKTFMGDTGSMFLGYVLSVISISGAFKGAATIALTIPILVLGVPIFDTAFAILRRCRRGQPFYVADKEHLHHRLVAMGMSTRAAVLTIYGISALLGTVAVVVSRLGEWEADVVYVGVCALLVIGAYKMGIAALRINDRYRQQRHG
jgi:UDP-GlcNAc:undecaprenyl-phosphate GlcNAc-1-phosphate transferase